MSIVFVVCVCKCANVCVCATALDPKANAILILQLTISDAQRRRFMATKLTLVASVLFGGWSRSGNSSPTATSAKLYTHM